MARKPVPEKHKARSAGISLPPQLIATARKVAFSKGLSLSAFVRTLLVERLDQEAA